MLCPRLTSVALFTLLTSFIIGIGCVHAKATKEEMTEGKERMKAHFESIEASYPPKDLVVKVYKAERRLEIWSRETLVVEYKVALGWEPEGHKDVEGDGRTPIGTYSIVTRHRSQFHLFLGLSYPNLDDAKVALEDGRIDKSEYREIKEKEEAGERPPWNTEMGGAIGIHGGGSSFDWTAGCIAVTNEEIEEIYSIVKLGTKIEVYP